MATKSEIMKIIGRELAMGASVIFGILVGMIILIIFWPDYFGDVHSSHTLVAQIVIAVLIFIGWTVHDWRKGKIDRW